MLADIWTVMRREWSECFRRADRVVGVGVILTAPLFGVILSLPWGSGLYTSDRWEEYFVSFPTGLAWFAAFGFVLRKRGRLNLEALLATPLPRDAILFGKIGSGVGFGLSYWLAMSVVSLLTLNLMPMEGPWTGIQVQGVLVIVALEFLISLSAATGGVLVAIGAAKITQIYKVIFLAFAGLVLLVAAVVWMGSDWVTDWLMGLQRVSVPMQFAIGFMVTFAVLDIVLILFAKTRIRQSHLFTGKS